MGRRGPAPSSAKSKKLRGNPGKRKPVEEVKLPAGCPEPPVPLVGRVRAIWDYSVSALQASGVLALADRDALFRYCIAQANVETLGSICAKLKFNSEADNKAMRLLTTSMRTASDLAEKLYLTPAARARLKAPDTPKEDDPLTKLLKAKAERKKQA